MSPSDFFNNMPIQFSIFKPYHQLIHSITTKSYGSFNDEEKNFENNLNKLSSNFNISRPVFADQIHGDKIDIINSISDQKPQCDALITQVKNLPLMIKIADCQAILLYDPKTESIAAIHSGWRSSAQNIIGKTIQKMKNKFNINPADILMGISPSLGPCCAEFSDPQNELPDFCMPYIKNNYVDFWTLSIAQCKVAGVPEKQIEIINECTKCNSDQYFSHRSGDEGRMAGFISLK